MATQTYKGSCHCQAVTYTVETDLSSVIACNCSICTRKGTLLAFAPAEKFQLHSGEDNLSDYQFNKKVIHHLFCTTCGVTSFARAVSPAGEDTVAINARCLEGVDPDTLTVQHYDGKSA